MYPKKGAILEGADADIIVWDPDLTKTITAKSQQSAIDYNVFEGIEVKGLPRFVLTRGEVAVDNGEITAKPGHGEFVAREARGAVNQALSTWKEVVAPRKIERNRHSGKAGFDAHAVFPGLADGFLRCWWPHFRPAAGAQGGGGGGALSIPGPYGNRGWLRLCVRTDRERLQPVRAAAGRAWKLMRPSANFVQVLRRAAGAAGGHGALPGRRPDRHPHVHHFAIRPGERDAAGTFRQWGTLARGGRVSMTESTRHLASAARPATPVVEASGLGLTFETADGPVHALSDFNLTIGKGE